MKRIINLFCVLLLVFSSLAVWQAVAVEFDCKNGIHDERLVSKTDKSATFNCVLCSFKYTYNLTDDGHLWSDWEVIKAPSCTEPGFRRHSCRVDEALHYEDEEIPPKQHSYSVSVIEPTCTKQGIKTYTCTVCGDSYFEEYDVERTHSYVEETVSQATCDTPGESLFTCTVCGDSYSKESPALGHAYGDWVVETHAAVGVQGLRSKVCANDAAHVINEVIPPLESPPAVVKPLPEVVPDKPTITALDVAVYSIDSLVLLVLLFKLFPIVSTISWEKKRRKEVLQKQLEVEERQNDYI